MRRDADVAAGARHGRTRDVPRASAELGQGGALYENELPARAERRDLDDGEDLPCAGPRRHLAALWAGGRRPHARVRATMTKLLDEYAAIVPRDVSTWQTSEGFIRRAVKSALGP